jgi:hypothetical protein
MIGRNVGLVGGHQRRHQLDQVVLVVGGGRPRRRRQLGCLRRRCRDAGPVHDGGDACASQRYRWSLAVQDIGRRVEAVGRPDRFVVGGGRRGSRILGRAQGRVLVQPGGYGGVVHTGRSPGFDVVGTSEQIPPAESSAVSGVDVEPILAVLAPAHHCGFLHRGEGYGGRPTLHLAAGRHTCGRRPHRRPRRPRRAALPIPGIVRPVRPYVVVCSRPPGSSGHRGVAAPGTLRAAPFSSARLLAPFSRHSRTTPRLFEELSGAILASDQDFLLVGAEGLEPPTASLLSLFSLELSEGHGQSIL